MSERNEEEDGEERKGANDEEEEGMSKIRLRGKRKSIEDTEER